MTVCPKCASPRVNCTRVVDPPESRTIKAWFICLACDNRFIGQLEKAKPEENPLVLNYKGMVE